jgi:hypothetical protein
MWRQPLCGMHEPLSQLGKELEGYTSTSGSLHFPVDQPLPEALVRELLAVRTAEVVRS